MIKNKISILDCKIENSLLYYQYSKHVIAYFCIELDNFKDFDNILEFIYNKKNSKENISIYDILENYFNIFIKLKKKTLSEIYNSQLLFKKSLKINFKKINIIYLKNSHLKRRFFFFLNDFNNNYKLIEKKNHILIKDKLLNKNTRIFQIKLFKTQFFYQNLRKISEFLQTTNIRGFLIISINSDIYKISFIITCRNLEKIENFLNFLKSFEMNKFFKLIHFSIRNFKDLIKKVELKEKLNFEKHEMNKIFTNSSEKSMKFYRNILKNSNDLENFLNSIDLKYNRRKYDKIIFIKSLKCYILNTGKNFLNVISNFLKKNYSKSNLVIFFLPKLVDVAELITNTNIQQLKNVRIYCKKQLPQLRKYLLEKRKMSNFLIQTHTI